MFDGGVVFAVERFGNRLQHHVGQVAGECHGNHPRLDEGFFAAAGEQLRLADAEILGDDALDVFDAGLFFLRLQQVGERRLGDGDGRRFVFFQHLALEDDFFQRAFEIAHVRFDVFGDEVGDVIRQREVLLFRLAF